MSLGVVAAILGVAAFANYSVICYVNPGGFPCITKYQVALLAPLYPLSAWLTVLGSSLAILGTFFTTLGQSRWLRIDRKISKIGQKSDQAN